jgi:hypothetical protein
MKNIGEGYWTYNGCDVYLAEHPKLQGKYEIYKGCDFIVRAYTLAEAKQKIIDRFGKNAGGKRIGAGRKKGLHTTQTIAFRVRSEFVDEIKSTVKDKVEELTDNSNK